MLTQRIERRRTMRQHTYIVTDGSAIGNPGRGGWAAILSSGRSQWHLFGAVRRTTASEMELTAAIEALKSLETGSRVTLCSDSEYLVHGMQHLADRWRRQGWLNSRGLPLRDEALWRMLLIQRARHTIRWRWIRGHNGHAVQTKADALAYSEARRQWAEMRMAAYGSEIAVPRDARLETRGAKRRYTHDHQAA